VGEVESLLGDDGVGRARITIFQTAQHHPLPAVLRASPGQGLEEPKLPLALLSSGIVGSVGHSLTIPQDLNAGSVSIRIRVCGSSKTRSSRCDGLSYVT
jgi:hypothetical protein